MLGGRDEEAGGAAGRIADDVVRGGGGHVHHEPDDVARRAELPVLPGGRDLAEHVLVEVALGVSVGHVDVVELVDDVGQHAGRGHHEEGVLHVMGVGRSLVGVACLTDRLDEGEHPVPHRLEHPLGRQLLETRPAQGVLAGGERRLRDRAAGAGGLVFVAGVQLVETLDEEQVGELLDDGEGVRDAAGPHGVPDSVDLRLQLAGDHDSVSLVSIESANGRDRRGSPWGVCPARGWSRGGSSWEHDPIRRLVAAASRRPVVPASTHRGGGLRRLRRGRAELSARSNVSRRKWARGGAGPVGCRPRDSEVRTTRTSACGVTWSVESPRAGQGDVGNRRDSFSRVPRAGGAPRAQAGDAGKRWRSRRGRFAARPRPRTRRAVAPGPHHGLPRDHPLRNPAGPRRQRGRTATGREYRSSADTPRAAPGGGSGGS